MMKGILCCAGGYLGSTAARRPGKRAREHESPYMMLGFQSPLLWHSIDRQYARGELLEYYSNQKFGDSFDIHCPQSHLRTTLIGQNFWAGDRPRSRGIDRMLIYICV